MRVLLATYFELVRRDLQRHCGSPSVASFCHNVTLCPGFKYSFWMRTAGYLRGCGWPALPLYAGARWVLKHYSFKYGIAIPYNTTIGPGLYIGHFGQIVVSAEASFGEDCNINQGVTVGVTYGGRSPGAPRIGNRVYLGPGSKVLGGITLGDDVAVGANCVVVDSVPDSGVVVGVPGKVISQKGSGAYVVNTGSARRGTAAPAGGREV